jgi:hypothetical protein
MRVGGVAGRSDEADPRGSRSGVGRGPLLFGGAPSCCDGRGWWPAWSRKSKIFASSSDVRWGIARIARSNAPRDSFRQQDDATGLML